MVVLYAYNTNTATIHITTKPVSIFKSQAVINLLSNTNLKMLSFQLVTPIGGSEPIYMYK